MGRSISPSIFSWANWWSQFIRLPAWNIAQSQPQYFPRLPRRVAEDDAWRDRGVQLVLAWFRSRWKSQTQCGKGGDGGVPFFEPVEDTTTWNFNESFRSIRVPLQRLRAADVGSTADAQYIRTDAVGRTNSNDNSHLKCVPNYDGYKEIMTKTNYIKIMENMIDK